MVLLLLFFQVATLVVILYIGLTSIVSGETQNHNHVYFTRVHETRAMKAEWRVSFVIDLEPLSIYLSQVEAHLEEVSEDINGFMGISWFEDTYSRLSAMQLRAFNKLKKRARGIRSAMTSLSHLRMRHKRAILNIGGILSYAFGVASNDDLQRLSSHIDTMRKEQARERHVLEESLSLINITHFELSRNRDTLNSVLDMTRDLQSRLENVTNALVIPLRNFMVIHSRVEGYIDDISAMLDEGEDHLRDIDLRLASVATGHLTPKLIPPNQLKTLLQNISKSLAGSVALPFDPLTHLWKYYQLLLCTSTSVRQGVLVQITLPLISQERWELIKVVNLPVPVEKSNYSRYYDLRMDRFAINIEQT